jgi:hypothetical protein
MQGIARMQIINRGYQRELTDEIRCRGRDATAGLRRDDLKAVTLRFTFVEA